MHATSTHVPRELDSGTERRARVRNGRLARCSSSSDDASASTAGRRPFPQAADPQHLLLAEVPFSELLGRRVVLVYDASSQGPRNAIASRLTTGVEDGLAVEVRGDALCFYARPHADLCQADWQALDNAIYGELCEFFQQGGRPTGADLRALAEDFRAGRFDYSRRRGGEEGEDVNKDDAGEDLQGALAEP